MSALYEMTNDLKELETLMDSLEESEDGGGDESMMLAIRDTLEGLQMEFNDKAVNIVKFAEALKGDVGLIDAEIKRLQERKKRITKRADSLKEYLRYNMEAAGHKKIECPLFTITLAKGRQSVQVSDVDQLPPEYVTTKVETKPDKTALAKALKAGEQIEGAELVAGASSLRVK